MKLLVGIIWLSVSVTAAALPENQCPVRTMQKPGAYELGLAIETVLPNRLPDFDISLPIYGPLIGVPFFGDLIQAQAFFGSLAGLSLYTLEANYRYNIPMPFFTAFLLAGGHYLQHTIAGRSWGYWGFNFGTGISFDMTNDFDINLIMKAYVQERSVFTFGGGFSFLL